MTNIQFDDRPLTSTEFIPALLQAASENELQCIQGGFGIDVSQMPDRTVICGTMWVLDQMFRRFPILH